MRTKPYITTILLQDKDQKSKELKERKIEIKIRHFNQLPGPHYLLFLLFAQCSVCTLGNGCSGVPQSACEIQTGKDEPPPPPPRYSLCVKIQLHSWVLPSLSLRKLKSFPVTISLFLSFMTKLVTPSTLAMLAMLAVLPVHATLADTICFGSSLLRLRLRLHLRPWETSLIPSLFSVL